MVDQWPEGLRTAETRFDRVGSCSGDGLFSHPQPFWRQNTMYDVRNVVEPPARITVKWGRLARAWFFSKNLGELFYALGRSARVQGVVIRS